MPTEFLEAYLHANEEQRRAALDALKGNTAAGLANNQPLPRIISPKALAELSNHSTRSLRRYAQKGLLKVARFDGIRGWGYTEQSVREFLERVSGIEAAEAKQAEPRQTTEVEVIEN